MKPRAKPHHQYLPAKRNITPTQWHASHPICNIHNHKPNVGTVPQGEHFEPTKKQVHCSPGGFATITPHQQAVQCNVRTILNQEPQSKPRPRPLRTCTGHSHTQELRLGSLQTQPSTSAQKGPKQCTGQQNRRDIISIQTAPGAKCSGFTTIPYNETAYQHPHPQKSVPKIKPRFDKY